MTMLCLKLLPVEDHDADTLYEKLYLAATDEDLLATVAHAMGKHQLSNDSRHRQLSVMLDRIDWLGAKEPLSDEETWEHNVRRVTLLTTMQDQVREKTKFIEALIIAEILSNGCDFSIDHVMWELFHPLHNMLVRISGNLKYRDALWAQYIFGATIRIGERLSAMGRTKDAKKAIHQMVQQTDDPSHRLTMNGYRVVLDKMFQIKCFSIRFDLGFLERGATSLAQCRSFLRHRRGLIDDYDACVLQQGEVVDYVYPAGEILAYVFERIRFWLDCSRYEYDLERETGDSQAALSSLRTGLEMCRGIMEEKSEMIFRFRARELSLLVVLAWEQGYTDFAVITKASKCLLRHIDAFFQNMSTQSQIRRKTVLVMEVQRLVVNPRTTHAKSATYVD
jgi:hypothetical protein